MKCPNFSYKLETTKFEQVPLNQDLLYRLHINMMDYYITTQIKKFDKIYANSANFYKDLMLQTPHN